MGSIYSLNLEVECVVCGLGLGLGLGVDIFLRGWICHVLCVG